MHSVCASVEVTDREGCRSPLPWIVEDTIHSDLMYGGSGSMFINSRYAGDAKYANANIGGDEKGAISTE
jgi:hypothetical protein